MSPRLAPPVSDDATKPPRSATYLGDAVYAQRDAFGNILLTTDNHDPRLAQNSIVLEPQVWEQLAAWVKRTTG